MDCPVSLFFTLRCKARSCFGKKTPEDNYRYYTPAFSYWQSAKKAQIRFRIHALTLLPNIQLSRYDFNSPIPRFVLSCLKALASI